MLVNKGKRQIMEDRHIWQCKYFPRQSLKRLTFLVKLSDSIFFLLGLSPIVKLI